MWFGLFRVDPGRSTIAMGLRMALHHCNGFADVGLGFQYLGFRLGLGFRVSLRLSVWSVE